jgi:hypothetical protein
MASYEDIRAIWGNVSNDALKAKVEVAVVVNAEVIMSDAQATTEQLKWASSVLSSPRSEAEKALMVVIVDSKSADIAQIQSASDATVQAKVDSIVGGLIAAYAAG